MLTSQLVEANLDFKGNIAILGVDGKVLLTNKGNLLVGNVGTDDVAQRHVLETLVLTDVVKVGNVDARRNHGSVKGENLERGKVGSKELVLFKLGTPGQHRHKSGGCVNELTKGASALLVDHGNKAFKLTTDTGGVAVGLDKANVTLDGGALVLDPESLGLLEGVVRARVESLGVSQVHVLLGLVGRGLRGALEVLGNLGHFLRVIAKDELDGLALERAVLNLVLGLRANVAALGRGGGVAGSNKNFKDVALFVQAGVFRQEVLAGHPSVDSLNISLGNTLSIRVVGGGVALVEETKKHLGLLRMVEHGGLAALVKLGGFGAGGDNSVGGLFAATGQELGVTKGLEVAHVAYDLHAILEEAGDLVGLDASLGGNRRPVSIAALVDGKNQVENVLGLERDLADGDSAAGKGGPGDIGLAAGAASMARRARHTC